MHDENGDNAPEDSTRDVPAATAPSPDAKTPSAVVIKKYANRRLYNTESSSYITLDTLADMVREGRDFVVYDAKSGEDITRSVLTQIIVEEESKGRALLPTAFLRQLIGFYGDSVQNLVPRYLEQALASFARQQEQVRRAVQQTVQQGLTPFMPFPIDEVRRQNLAMMERAMSLFSPFYRESDTGDGKAAAASPVSSAPSVEPPVQEAEVAALRLEVETLRYQLAQAIQSAATPLAAPPSEPATPGDAAEPPVGGCDRGTALLEATRPVETPLAQSAVPAPAMPRGPRRERGESKAG